jgi:DNA-binding LacI/PurR family transcriptional regulator
MNYQEDLKTPTSKDVASLAGVSQATVSRVFSSYPGLSPHTKKKVLDAANVLNYQPNAFARNLVTSSSNFIGIVKGYTRNTVFNEILSALVQSIQNANRQIIYFETEEGQVIDDLSTHILQYQIEGLILLYANLSTELTASCQKRGIPVLEVLRYSTLAKTNAVLPNNQKAAEDAAALFEKRGFTNFLYIGGDVNSSTNMERHLGFSKKLQELGFSKPILYQGDYTYESGIAAMRFAAKNMSLPFAILSANDLMAFGAMDTLKYELGYTIGKDVALIGFDNMFMSEWPTYSLTTFSQPISLMVQDGVTLLLNNITNKNMTPVRKRYPLQLIERNSTRV